MMELDQDELKEVSSRQISLSDFDRLAQIEDIKTRNKVLKDIGTYNFDGAVTRAIREEHRKKVTPAAKKQVKALGLKEIPDSDRYSGKYDSVSHINLDTWDPESGLGLKDTAGILYSLDHWGNLYFYKKRERAAQKRSPRPRLSGKRPSPTPTLPSRRKLLLPLSLGKSSSAPSLSRRRHLLHSCAAP